MSKLPTWLLWVFVVLLSSVPLVWMIIDLGWIVLIVSGVIGGFTLLACGIAELIDRYT